jgi:hypothetical protein
VRLLCGTDWVVICYINERETGRAVTWLRGLVTGLSLRRHKFDPMSVHVRFVVHKVALLHVSFPVLRFPLSLSHHQCSLHKVLLAEGRRGEAGEPSKKAMLCRELGDIR